MKYKSNMGSTESQGGFIGGPTWGSPVSSCMVATGKNATRKNKNKNLKNMKNECARGLICKGDGARHCPHGGHIDLKMHLYKFMRSPDLPWGVQSKNFRNFGLVVIGKFCRPLRGRTDCPDTHTRTKNGTLNITAFDIVFTNLTANGHSFHFFLVACFLKSGGNISRSRLP